MSGPEDPKSEMIVPLALIRLHIHGPVIGLEDFGKALLKAMKEPPNWCEKLVGDRNCRLWPDHPGRCL